MQRSRLLPRLRTAVRLLVIGFASSGCGGQSPPPWLPAPVGRGAQEPPGVVLLCLDTLRADAVFGGSGDGPSSMPRLGAFAGRCVSFADAVAPTAWTGPSLTAALTGLDPGTTGVYGSPERFAEPPAAVRPIGVRLADAGWFCGAVTNGTWFTPGQGALRGFSAGVVGLDRDPAAALAALDARRPRGVPFVYFLHSSGAHDPYYDAATHAPVTPSLASADASFVRAAGDRYDPTLARFARADLPRLMELWTVSPGSRAGLEAILGAARLQALGHEIRRWLDDGAERDPELAARGARLRAAYERSLPFVDELFGRILGAIDGLGLPPGTVLVVFSDHGEAFGEHGTYLHGRRLHDEMLRIPLLVRLSAGEGGGRTIRGEVSLVDILPTVFDLAGLPVPKDVDGVSLRAALVGTGAAARLPTRVVRGYEERAAASDVGTRWERHSSFRTCRTKYIVRRDRATGAFLGAERFELESDPHERSPRALTADEVERALEEAGAGAAPSPVR